MVAADLYLWNPDLHFSNKLVERKKSLNHLLCLHKANFTLSLLSKGEEMARDNREFPYNLNLIRQTQGKNKK